MFISGSAIFNENDYGKIIATMRKQLAEVRPEYGNKT